MKKKQEEKTQQKSLYEYRSHKVFLHSEPKIFFFFTSWGE